MANVYVGDSSSFNNMLYGIPNRNVINYFNQNLNKVTNTLKHFGGSLVQDIRSIYDRYYSNESINNAKDLLAKSSVIIDNNTIIQYTNELNDIGRQIVLSYPDIRSQIGQPIYNNFSEYDVDISHLDDIYALSQDGLIKEDKHGSYIEQTIVAGRDNFTTLEQGNILNMYDKVSFMLAAGIDPTVESNHQ